MGEKIGLTFDIVVLFLVIGARAPLKICFTRSPIT